MKDDVYKSATILTCNHRFVALQTTQAMLAGFDQNTLMQLHQLFAGADESRARAILEQYQQQQRSLQQVII
ncbi:hypothetical protein ANCCAN_21247 [Ancylostoma caninum]|uniref:Uncharacterized protein n=1 Tax=Ancylostoma caninum TaxID=29170 RepID=A0A368FRV6_ANCCA|nr:hypothetical protein ANCCAN_21247 [Ancylostoma caninum]